MGNRGSKDVEKDPSDGNEDYWDVPSVPLFQSCELLLWSFYRACIAEFMATLLFLYVALATVITEHHHSADCSSVGVLGIAWAFGGFIFILVYCTAGISGGHIKPAVTFSMLVRRKLTLTRAFAYMIAQCLGAICGAALVKSFQGTYYVRYGGGANVVAPGYTKGVGLATEVMGTFILVYTVFSAIDPKRKLRIPVSLCWPHCL